MLEVKNDCYKGTRILIGNEKRSMINSMTNLLINEGYQEIIIPIIQFQSMFANKVGEENNNLMFNFKDRGNRDICLAPEYTAVVQKLALDRFKYEKDLKLFYVQECFRGENPQAGRYRQFTQLGVEIINPTMDYNLCQVAQNLLSDWCGEMEINENATRGLDYYKDGKGFEIAAPELGAQKQICGGGAYQGGVGFAIGIDRLLLCSK